MMLIRVSILNMVTGENINKNMVWKVWHQLQYSFVSDADHNSCFKTRGKS